MYYYEYTNPPYHETPGGSRFIRSPARAQSFPQHSYCDNHNYDRDASQMFHSPIRPLHPPIIDHYSLPFLRSIGNATFGYPSALHRTGSQYPVSPLLQRPGPASQVTRRRKQKPASTTVPQYGESESRVDQIPGTGILERPEGQSSPMSRVARSTIYQELLSSPAPATPDFSRVRQPSFPLEYRFVSGSAKDPSRRGKKSPTSDQKLLQGRMCEIGGACIWCSEKRKVCDLNEVCAPCRNAGVRCVRGAGDFYLFDEIEDPTSFWDEKGAYKRTVIEYRDRGLGRVHATLQNLQATPVQNPMGRKIILEMKNGSKSVQVEIPSSDLFNKSFCRVKNLDRLCTMLKGLVVVVRPNQFHHLAGKKPEGEAELLKLVESAVGTMSVLKALQYSVFYGFAHERQVAARLSSLTCVSLVNRLGIDTVNLCSRLRHRLRHKKGHYAETRYAIAMYFLIAVSLMELRTGSVIDDFVNPLRVRFPELLDVIDALFEKTNDTLANEKKKSFQLAMKSDPHSDGRGATVRDPFQGMLNVSWNLPGFIDVFGLCIPEVDQLEFSFYEPTDSGIPIGPRAQRQIHSLDGKDVWMMTNLLRRNVIDPTLLDEEQSGVQVPRTSPSKTLVPKVKSSLKISSAPLNSTMPVFQTPMAGPFSAPLLSNPNMPNYANDATQMSASYTHYPHRQFTGIGDIDRESHFAITSSQQTFDAAYAPQSPDVADPEEDDELSSMFVTEEDSLVDDVFVSSPLKRQHESGDSVGSPSKRQALSLGQYSVQDTTHFDEALYSYDMGYHSLGYHDDYPESPHDPSP